MSRMKYIGISISAWREFLISHSSKIIALIFFLLHPTKPINVKKFNTKFYSKFFSNKDSCDKY